jgi:helicase
MFDPVSIPIESLVAHGFSRRVVETWRAHGYRELLPLQAKALAEYPFLRGGNLVVFAPTSSGKTFVAEMAAVRHLEQGHKVVYLVPTKALAEEKFRQWLAMYRALGLRIAIATRERPETDGRVLEGRFDLLIAVYEKMKSYLVVQPEILSQIKLVVVDELQMLADPARGATLELVLLKMIGSPSPSQLIALSAVLADATRLSQWMRSDLLLDKQRPVELREGVFNCADGQFYYTCFNSGEQGREVLAPEAAAGSADALAATSPESADESFGREIFLHLARRLAQELDEQVLVFVPTRAMSRQWAYEIAYRVDFGPIEPALAELESFEPSHARDLMKECLSRSVAYHNAELSWEMRRLVEQYYNSGDIRILISTSTLGQGVNLSGRNVLHVGQMVTSDTWTGQPSFVPLGRDRFRNQGGRGARFGRESRFGRSILVARDTAESQRLARLYLAGGYESLPPALAGRNLEAIVCDLVASNIARTRSDVARLLEASYTSAILWAADLARFRRELDAVIGEALKKQLLVERENGRLEATGLGRVVAVQGIQPTTAARFARWFKQLGNRKPTDGEMLLVAALTPDADDCPVPLSSRERSSSVYAAAVGEIIGAAAQSDDLLREALEPPGGWTEPIVAALKKCLILHRWIGPTETELIEEQSGMFSGTLLRLAQHFQWLIQALGAVAEAFGGQRGLVAHAARLAQRLHYGVEPRCLRLAGLKVEAMTRSYLRAVVHEGFDSIEAVAEADPEHLARWIPRRVAVELVERARYAVEQRKARSEKEGAAAAAARRPSPAGRRRPRGRPDSPVVGRPDSPVVGRPDSPVVGRPDSPVGRKARDKSVPPTDLPRLLFDRGQPDRVVIGDAAVALTPYPYELFRLLAANAGRVISYREIDEALWPDAKVEPQQISAHKRAIVRALAGVIGEDRARQIVETVARRGLRLNLPPESIRMKK